MLLKCVFFCFNREEDEYEDAAVQSNKSNDGGSRAANESQANSLGQSAGYNSTVTVS